jgi:hypothetical protein
MYLAIDPGESSNNGYALFDETGFCTEFDQITRDTLMDLLDEYSSDLTAVVIEDFTLFKSKALQQSGSKLETVRIIGAVEDFCRRHNITCVKQPASHLTIAQLWSGKKLPKNHSKSHWVSAYNHGYYYLVKQKVIKLKVRPE